jgi:hypothetical protein
VLPIERAIEPVELVSMFVFSLVDLSVFCVLLSFPFLSVPFLSVFVSVPLKLFRREASAKLCETDTIGDNKEVVSAFAFFAKEGAIEEETPWRVGLGEVA